MIQFKNSNQMKAFMKKEAVRLNMDIRNIYTTFVARCILERLSRSAEDKILIKGSSAEIAYLGRCVRAITDIDIALTTDIQERINLITSILTDRHSDILDLKLTKGIAQTPTGIYKLSMEACFDKIRQPIGMDIQENYSRLIEPEYRMMPPIFEGDEPFPIYVPSFEEYLAEKLCIIVESDKEDVPNTRVKDFYDIYQLHGGKYDSDKLTKYFKMMLELRGKTTMENIRTLRLNSDFINKHSDIWDKTKLKYDFMDDEIDLDGAVYYTRAVIRDLLQRNGMDMHDNIAHQNKRKVYKI